MRNQIPKIIHYCWFGGNTKSELIEKCIASWKDKLPDYKMIEWNETNFDVNSHPYTRKAYGDKKWAFVSDYVRLHALSTTGGVYLDTDMYIVKNIDNLLDNICVVGKEDDDFINAAFLAATTNSKYVRDLILEYDKLTSIETIPRVMTRLIKTGNYANEVTILERNSFYPFSAENIKDFKINKSYTNNKIVTNAPKETYGVHMWNYSWGHPLVKLSKKIGIHRRLVIISDKLKIKKILKKLLKTT